MKTNWQTKKLGEVCDIYQPKTISKKEMIVDGEYPVFGANGIIGKYNKYNHEKSELLITCRGATCGSVNVSIPRSWINGNAMVIRPLDDKQLSKDFLRYFFIGIDLSSVITGSAQPQITRQTLSPFQIPLPPLPEQHRIVKILDEVFADVAKAKENAEKNLQNAKDLFESYLQSVFANPGKDWEEKILNDVCEDILAGGDKPKGAFSKFKTDEFQIPIFSNGIKNDGLYGYTNTARIKKPSITISARGTIGYSVIRREAFFPIIRLIVLTPNDDLIDLDFLHYSIKNNSIIGNGTSIPQLTVPAVKKIKISFPKSLKIQKEIIKKLDELSHQTKKLETIYQQKLADLEELKKSVLKKAFNGGL